MNIARLIERACNLRDSVEAQALAEIELVNIGTLDERCRYLDRQHRVDQLLRCIEIDTLDDISDRVGQTP